MANALSRLKQLGLYHSQDQEPNGVKFGHTIIETLPNIHLQHINATLQPIPVQNCQADEMADHQ